MRIVYCLQALHRKGGIERVITTKANYLVSAGYEVHIVTTDQRNGPIAFPLDERVQLHDLGLNYELDNNLGRWGRIKALIDKRPKHQNKLEALLREIKADITISTFFQDAPILPKLRDGSKKVLEMHTSRFAREYMYPPSAKLMRLYGRLRSYLDERLARKYDAFVILTEVERPLFRNQKNIHVIPNACVLAVEGKSSLQHKQAIAIGRLEYVKNFESLIRVWAKVHEQQPDWHLTIYGEGPLRRQLEAQVEALGLQNVVKLPGASNTLDKAYMDSSVCLMTSHFEGLPMTLIEAQMHGLPIVAYACPSGPKEIVHDSIDGYLIPEGNEEAFAEKVLQIIDNKELLSNLSDGAYISSQRYRIDEVMDSWIKLLDRLLVKT